MNMMRWMARNHVAANILMAVILIGGLVMASRVRRELFPETEPDIVRITVAYPGASPEEVENGVILPIEEAVGGVVGIKEIKSTATEGMAVVSCEVEKNQEAKELLNDIKSEVDRITVFPQNIEEPEVAAQVNRSRVVDLMVHGDVDEATLRKIAEGVREDLLATDEISQVTLTGVRPYEISIEIGEENLRRFDLTLSQVADIVRAASTDMPGGVIKAEGGELLVRTTEKKYVERDYNDVTVVAYPDGRRVKLGDIAIIKDDFAETDTAAYFNGRRAAIVQAFRVGEEDPTRIADKVNEYIASRKDLPTGVQLTVWQDFSIMYRERMDLLLRNAKLGLILVMVALGIFLEIRLAFWVMLGIPTAFLGAIMLMPMFDVSINMVSMFAFIICLGIVVDDATVIGESIYLHRAMGKSAYQAAVDGVAEVAGPVLFSVLTTVAVFVPLMMIGGTMGQIWRVVPLIVIPVLLFSLIESLFILPAHLNKETKLSANPLRKRFDRGLAWFTNKVVTGFAEQCVRYRYATLGFALASLMIAFGLIASGFVRYTYFPTIEGDEVRAKLTMPFGTPAAETEVYRAKLQQAVEGVIAKYDSQRADGVKNMDAVYSIIGSGMESWGSRGQASDSSRGGHLAEIAVRLKPMGTRNCSAEKIAAEWRAAIGEIPGAEKLTFSANLLHSAPAITVHMSHPDSKTLEAAGERIKQKLSGYSGIGEISDDSLEGKRELKLTLKPQARALGITESELGMQVRSAFYGAEALRIQRGRDEVKVMVRYPEADRKNLNSLQTMRIRTPAGGEAPFVEAAYVDEGRSYGAINRKDRRRVLNVTAEANRNVVNPDDVIAELKESFLPQLQGEYPGLMFGDEGEQQDRKETGKTMMIGFLLSQVVNFGMMAIQLRSYIQPLIIMAAIPFGFLGALLGHILLGYDLSIVSMMGLITLSGVVVNNSLILIDYINICRSQNMGAYDAVKEAVRRRFRPIILTSLTTFFGVASMIFEKSMQARFLIPMAISMGFGIMFSGLIVLVLVPCLYMAQEDILKLLRIKRVIHADIVPTEIAKVD